MKHPAGWRYSWDLVTHLVAREFRLRYRQALLGWLWAVGTPLTRLVILTYLFTQVLPLGIENYPVFVFTGLVAWQWFSGGLTSATTSAVDRRDLLFRPGLPRTAVPVVSVLTDGLDYLAALPVLFIFLLLATGFRRPQSSCLCLLRFRSCRPLGWDSYSVQPTSTCVTSICS